MTRQAMEKSDKINLSDRSSINLENLFSSEANLRDSGGGQLLFDKDSSSGDAMKSITPPNEKDDAYIDNLKNQQQGKQINFIFNKLYQRISS